MPLTHLENPLKNGESIRIARRVRGWSQRHLSEVSGIPQWRIWKFENRLLAPDDEEAARVWAALSTG